MLRGGWLWSLGLVLWAQTGQNIRLVIYDRETEEPLVGASVRWPGGGTYTDTLGPDPGAKTNRPGYPSHRSPVPGLCAV